VTLNGASVRFNAEISEKGGTAVATLAVDVLLKAAEATDEIGILERSFDRNVKNVRHRMGASAASTLWFCQANIGFGSIRVFKAKATGLAGIQFHIRSQLQGAHPGNISAFDPDD